MTKLGIDEILSNAISKHSLIGTKITKKVAEKLKSEFVFDKMPSDLSLIEIRDILIKNFKILEEDQTNQAYTIIVNSGLLNLNAAIVVLKIEDKNILLNAYAIEGLIKQNTTKKAIKNVKRALK